MEIKFGSEIILSYKRLSYTLWYAIAEFVDNSTEAYIRNQKILDPILKHENKSLTIRVEYSELNDQIIIEDNSIGMSKDELANALVIGKLPNYKGGRSIYGLGLKTAACWLGNYWTVRTKKLNETKENFISIDVDEVAKDATSVYFKEVDGKPKDTHYTVVTIEKLNRKINGISKKRIKDFLSSMYRKDFQTYNLQLIWQGEVLQWDYDKMINRKLYVNKNKEQKRKLLNFYIGEGKDKKHVTGWVGVFEKGSRRDAGFSILQNNRVIKGWPDAYRPESLFGEGRNDLTNQRLVGELELDDFAISHTKDEIIFLNNEQEELEDRLFEECVDFKNFALDYRKYMDDERRPPSVDRALNQFEKEIRSAELKDKILMDTIPERTLLEKSKLNLIDAVTKRMPASLKAKVDSLDIMIYLDNELSPNDPYILIESTQSRSRVIVIINMAHPHWSYLKVSESILNFIRHCTYDGIAEWKANFVLSRLDPDTIKRIKDGLLRVPLEIEQHESD